MVCFIYPAHFNANLCNLAQLPHGVGTRFFRNVANSMHFPPAIFRFSENAPDIKKKQKNGKFFQLPGRVFPPSPPGDLSTEPYVVLPAYNCVSVLVPQKKTNTTNHLTLLRITASCSSHTFARA